jgi:phosphoribosylaminoimidazole-succinocarboxamide synthase
VDGRHRQAFVAVLKSYQGHCAVRAGLQDDVHDRPVSAAEIVSEGLMSEADWSYVSAKALEVFAFGQQTCAQRGLILVDTKYEFGRDRCVQMKWQLALHRS